MTLSGYAETSGIPHGGHDLGPIGHTAVSVGIGTGVWAATGEPLAVPAAFAAGVLNDADHLVDYYLWYIKDDRRRLILAFHGWEYAVAGVALAALVWAHPALLAAALAHAGHLVGDQVANRPGSLFTYSLVYRARARFERTRLVRWTPPTLSDALNLGIPLWPSIEPRLPPRVSRFLGLEQ